MLEIHNFCNKSPPLTLNIATEIDNDIVWLLFAAMKLSFEYVKEKLFTGFVN